MSLSEFLITRHETGTYQMFGGRWEWDPDWRSRDLFAGYEPAESGQIRKLTRAERLASLVCETNIEFILGKPGGGKSMYATKTLLDELLHSHRPIVTNLAVNLTALQEYVFSLGRFDIHVRDRIRLLDHEEVFRFFLIRGQSLELPMPKTADGVIDWKLSQEDEEAAGGVFYIIDEAHNYFPTKAPIAEDSPMFKWASQHRKLKDYCYFVTQSVENMHVKVRRLGQLYNYIRNLRKETFRGFRRGDGFQRCGYLSIPTGRRDEDYAIVNEKFRLDVKGLASCYHTAGGVGVSGAGVADGGFQKKGLHMRWLYAFAGGAVLLIIGLFLLLPWLGGKAGGAVVEHAVGSGHKAEPSVAPAVGLASAPALAASMLAPAPAHAPAVAAPVAPLPSFAPAYGEVYPVGYVVRGRKVTVQMSDGTTRTDRDAEVSAVERNSVTIDGRKLFFRAAPRLPASAPATAPLVPRAPDPEPSGDAVAQSAPWDASTGGLGMPSGRIGR